MAGHDLLDAMRRRDLGAAVRLLLLRPMLGSAPPPPPPPPAGETLPLPPWRAPGGAVPGAGRANPALSPDLPSPGDVA